MAANIDIVVTFNTHLSSVVNYRWEGGQNADGEPTVAQLKEAVSAVATSLEALQRHINLCESFGLGDQ